MTKPVKGFASIDDQVALLKSRGMILETPQARQWLRSVGYYRLSGYWYPYRCLVTNADGDTYRSDAFESATCLDDVVAVYEFDRKLRTLIHDGIERIEVALRSHVSYVIGNHDPLAYREPSLYRSWFDLSDWLTTAKQRVKRARRHSEPVRHHEVTYGGELPIWVLTDVLDFSDVSKLYGGLRSTEQKVIAELLGVTLDLSTLGKNARRKISREHPLARWLEQLTILRNTCAHHSRVWNRSYTPVSTTALRTIDALRPLPEGQSEKLYGALTVMCFLLREISPGSSWGCKVRDLVDTVFVPVQGRTEDEMGFPPGWRSEQLWAAPTELPINSSPQDADH